jgi:3-deoxy-D-manno-octulosonic-acid transferase
MIQARALGTRQDRGGPRLLGAVQALRDGRTVAMTADVPGGIARKAGLGIVMVARRSGRPILPVAIATSRYISLNTWSRMTINLPHSGLGFAVGELVSVPREAGDAELESCRQAVEASLNIATEKAYARAGADPSRATPGLQAANGARPDFRLKAYRTLTSLARPVAPLLLGFRERHGKEEPARRGERLGQASAERPAGRLAWFHAASVGETIAILPLMSALAEQRPSLSFLLTTGTVTSAKLAAQRIGPRAVHQYAPLDAPGMSRASSTIGSPTWRYSPSPRSGQPDWKLDARHSAGPHQRAHDQALVPALAHNLGFARPIFSRFAVVLAQNEGWPGASPRWRKEPAHAGSLKVDAPPPRGCCRARAPAPDARRPLAADCRQHA